MKYLLVGGNMIFAVSTVINPALQYTRWLPAYLGFSFVLIVYALVIVVLALLNDRAGVSNVVISVVLGLVIFGYDLLSYGGFFIYNSIIFCVGYITVFVMLGIALLRHLRILHHRSQQELTYDDLYKPKKK
jgi:asparagine N-glycosylation enzyme membrane subunit Stt3